MSTGLFYDRSIISYLHQGVDIIKLYFDVTDDAVQIADFDLIKRRAQVSLKLLLTELHEQTI